MKYISLIFTLLVMINASAEEVLSSNERHNCAIKDDGTIVCWGSSIKTPPNDTNFARISAGQSYNCALKTDGSMDCWGLGTASKAQEGKFTQISAGQNHGCAIKFDKSVICWGSDGGTDKTKPPSDQLWLQVSAGYLHSCGITTDKNILCWGKELNGETTPPSGTFSEVSAGNQFTCGIKTDGTLACWGKDDKKQTSAAPKGQFSKLSVGKYDACAIKSDNSIACWGKSLQEDVPSGRFDEISVGSTHACAKKTDNSVECWGSNLSKLVTPPEGLKLIYPAPEIPITFTLTIIPENCDITRSIAGPYPPNTEVTLEATANEGYFFSHWEKDGVKETDNPYTITMDKDKTITGVCNLDPKPSIFIDPVPKGGSISPDQRVFEKGEEVILTAKPERCYTFEKDGWSGDCSAISDTDNRCKLIMDTDKTISANFVEAKFSLELIAEHGKIIAVPAKNSYDCDEEVTLTATPDEGYVFVRWEGDITGSNKEVNITMDSDKEIKAIFEAIPVELSVSSNGNGTVSGEPTTTVYNQEVTLTANAHSCSKFKQWLGACNGNMPTCTITLKGNTNVIAEFEPETFTLTTNAINGQVIRNPDNEIYDCGSTVQLTAVPNDGFKFVNWRGDASGSGANISIEMTEDKNITAEFAIDGILNISPKTSQIYTEEKVELTALDGVPPYTWSSTGGQLPINKGEKVFFSANVPGNYQVTVTDNNGKNDVATVEVSPQFSLSPQYVPDLPVNEIQAFTITGGKPPYLLTTTLGVSQSINPDANGIATYNFTAPENPGIVTLTVKDSLTGELSSIINIVLSPDPKITPSGTVEIPIILYLGEAISLKAKGGVPPYSWTATAGDLSGTEGQSVTYIAPPASGEQTITVTDSKGNKAEVHVKVVNELVCSPHLTTMILGDKTPITFRAMGGAEPYRWQVEAGTIEAEGAEVNYQPPVQEGEFTVTCTDIQDKSVTPLVRVVKGLNVSPAEKLLAIGESTNLQVAGGQAPFTWVAECGDLNRTDGTSVVYTAPQRNGVCEVTVTDALSQAAKVRIQVIGNLIISPIKTVVAIGETVTISAARGTEPYTWFDGKTGQIWSGTFNNVGRHEVVVTDAAGDTGLAVVDIIHNNLGLTPERAFLSINEIQNITVAGGTSPYAWNAEAGTLSSVKGTRVAYIAPDQPGSYNITVRDGRDVQGQVKVIVKADVIELESGKPRNDKGSISSNIIVNGVERHDKEILVDKDSYIEASFSLEMPNDGQNYKVYGALYWIGLEQQPVLFFKTLNQQGLVRHDPNQEFPVYTTAAAGETVVVKDIYNGPLSNYSGHQMVFYVGYAAVGTDVLKGLLFNATQPYNVLVK
jgi:alpha-tubulin suppressor-like RCC1 family protein